MMKFLNLEASLLFFFWCIVVDFDPMSLRGGGGSFFPEVLLSGVSFENKWILLELRRRDSFFCFSFATGNGGGTALGNLVADLSKAFFVIE
jgi:hypothetical protein